MEPIAKRLHQSAENVLCTTTKRSKEEENDITERIRRLEAELQGAQRNDDASDSDMDSDSDQDQPVVNLSAYASERIEALPDHLLPAARPLSSILLPATKKRKLTQQEENKRAATKALELLGDALTFTKRIPFACKPCKFIGTNMDEFKAHGASKEHLERVQLDDKTLQCVLCNKSFTSQAQVDEHREGKWHKQRAQQKKQRHVVKLCYDFMRGECTWGDRCCFEHKETKAMRSGRTFDTTRRRVCDTFAQTKTCRYGDKCLFFHTTK